MKLPFRITFWRAALALTILAGFVAAVVRFGMGLGAATNLSDAFPWGMWIGFDVLVGVGLAAGGFTVAATVHIFHLEKYEPIARPAVLTAFLGYLLVVVGLLFDLGQPWDIWHPLVMWNPHSVMFEVAWCVMLYTTVLALEFSPIVLERFNLKLPLRAIRAIYVPLVILGVLLSMMHQSSLGSLYVIAPDKLYGLWYTPWLPVFFFISAVAAGLAMTIVESYFSFRAFGKRLEDDLLEGLGRVMVVVLAVYAVFKFEDLATRGNLHLAFQVTPESVLFWGEMGLGVALPMVLVFLRKVRESREGLFFASLLTVMGFIVNRLNVAITGMERSSGVSYFPSALELLVTISLVAAGFAGFALAVKYLRLFPPHELKNARPPAEVPALGKRGMPTANGYGLAALWALLAVGAVLVVTANSTEAESAAGTTPATERTVEAGDLSLPADFTFPTAAESPGAVVFSHGDHVDTSAPNCAICHDKSWSLVSPGQPLTGSITHDRVHGKELCGACHDGERAFGVADDCSGCHQ